MSSKAVTEEWRAEVVLMSNDVALAAARTTGASTVRAAATSATFAALALSLRSLED